MKLSKRKVYSVVLSMSIITGSIAVPAYGAEFNNFDTNTTAFYNYVNQSYAVGESSGTDGDEAWSGTGISQSGDYVNLQMVRNKNGGEDYTYYLRNTDYNFKTCVGENGWGSFDPSPFNKSPISFGAVFSEFDDNFNSGTNTNYQQAAVDAHYNVTKTMKYFDQKFNRKSQDGSNQDGEELIVAIITNNPPPPEAPYTVPMGWGSKNYVGLHIATSESKKTISYCLDAVAHEYSHGILESNGLTVSSLEEKAISEGVGDVFGVLVERHFEGAKGDWIIGEDIFAEGEAWRRDASKPKLMKFENCDDYNNNKYNYTQNELGGLISRAAYLMAEGSEKVNAIGYEKLELIFYKTITSDSLSTATTLNDFAKAVVQAVNLLYGDNSEACISTRNAFIEVGLLDKTTDNPTSLNSASGFGFGQSGKTRPLNIAVDEKGTYYLKDIEKKFGTYPGVVPKPYTNATVGSLFSEPDNNFDSWESVPIQDVAVDAHYNLEKVINFFSNKPFYRTGHDSIDSELVLCIVGDDVQWSGADKNYIQIHNGISKIKGVSAANCIDIIAHEYTHVMLYASGLSDQDQESLALHEGLADVFGVLAEYNISNNQTYSESLWIHGSELDQGSRDCANPKKINDYDDYTNYNKSDDNTNEKPESHDVGGIITKAAYLMGVGGNHNEVTVKAIGYEKLASIFYKVINDGSLKNEVSLKEFANYAVQAAESLYGSDSEAYKSTKDAFIAVHLLDNTPEDEVLKGDVNGDGVFNAIDFAYMRKVLLGLQTFTDKELKAADVNRDGFVNAIDFAIMRKVLLGMQKDFE